jgi:hypothetical protein
VVLWIGSNFNAGLYLLTSKIQAVLWSAGDVVLVFAALRIADLARRKAGMRRLNVLYGLLWLTVLLTPLLVFAATRRQFFLLECTICGLQFLILLYVALSERSRILELLVHQSAEAGNQPQRRDDRKENLISKSIRAR